MSNPPLTDDQLSLLNTQLQAHRKTAFGDNIIVSADALAALLRENEILKHAVKYPYKKRTEKIT